MKRKESVEWAKERKNLRITSPQQIDAGMRGIPKKECWQYAAYCVMDEKEALYAAGFTQVEELNQWEVTHTLKAVK